MRTRGLCYANCDASWLEIIASIIKREDEGWVCDSQSRSSKCQPLCIESSSAGVCNVEGCTEIVEIPSTTWPCCPSA